MQIFKITNQFNDENRILKISIFFTEIKNKSPQWHTLHKLRFEDGIHFKTLN